MRQLVVAVSPLKLRQLRKLNTGQLLGKTGENCNCPGNYSFPQKLSSVEFPVTFSQFLLNLDCESICDPPGGDTLLAQGIYLTDS